MQITKDISLLHLPSENIFFERSEKKIHKRIHQHKKSYIILENQNYTKSAKIKLIVQKSYTDSDFLARILWKYALSALKKDEYLPTN